MLNFGNGVNILPHAVNGVDFNKNRLYVNFMHKFVVGDVVIIDDPRISEFWHGEHILEDIGRYYPLRHRQRNALSVNVLDSYSNWQTLTVADWRFVFKPLRVQTEKLPKSIGVTR